MIKKKKPLKTFKIMLRPMIQYSFTFNFNDTYQHFDSNSARRPHELIDASKRLHTILNDFCVFKLYPEFSTPESHKCLYNKPSRAMMGTDYGNKGARFHYHGTIVLTDVMNFYLTGYQRLLKYGVFEIDTIDDKSIWDEYCTKDKIIMKQFMKSYKKSYFLTNTNSI